MVELKKVEATDKPIPAAVHDHTPEGIQKRLQTQPTSYLSDFLYGAIDGIVTTFAVVSGVTGAGLSSGIVLVLGLANLVGDGFSMAASNFSGTRADNQLMDKAREDEARAIDEHPEGEREEIRQIYAKKGFRGRELEGVVNVICSNKSSWLDTMLREELGMHVTKRSPLRCATATFLAFVFIGAVPLLPYALQLITPQLSSPHVWSSVCAGLAFFSVGAAKSRFVQQHWALAGAETLLLGGCAAGLAYGVGWFLRGLVAV